MMSHIPNDILINILEESSQIKVYPSILSQFSLAKRSYLDLARPFLFKNITFDLTDFLHSDSSIYMANLIRSYSRARSLLKVKSRPLLQLVKTFSILGWSNDFQMPEHTGLEALLQEVYRVISNLPVDGLMRGLQHVRVEHSPVTARLHRSIFSSSRKLRSVVIWTVCTDSIQSFPLEPMALPILDLKYTVLSPVHSPAAAAYLVYLVRNSMSTLKCLTVRHRCPVAVLVTCAAQHPHLRLPLQKLNVVIPSGEASLLWDLFPLLPDLRSLEVFDWAAPLRPLSHLSTDVLPQLESLIVQPYLAPTLTMGKRLTEVDLTGKLLDTEVYSIGEIIQSSSSHLRGLEVSIIFRSYQGFLSFLVSLRRFENLQGLRVDICGRVPRAKHEKDITRTEICDAMAKELRRWKLLRSCSFSGHLWGQGRIASEDPWGEDIDEREVPCPIAPERDPNSRGHPSLQEFSMQFLMVSSWYWSPENGWMRAASPA